MAFFAVRYIHHLVSELELMMIIVGAALDLVYLRTHTDGEIYHGRVARVYASELRT